jgi:hypothetical protein
MSNESRDAMNLNTKEKWHIDYQSDESVAGLLAHMLWVDVGVVVTFDSNNGGISREGLRSCSRTSVPWHRTGGEGDNERGRGSGGWESARELWQAQTHRTLQ